MFDEYDDSDIYAALRRVHLLKDEAAAGQADEETRNKNVFRDLANPVSEGGDNFSSGEKQLIWSAVFSILVIGTDKPSVWRVRYCAGIEFYSWTRPPLQSTVSGGIFLLKPPLRVRR